MKKIKYERAPKDIEAAIIASRPIKDFLPAPSDLAQKVEKEKITIMIDKEGLDFFRAAAKKYGVGYQTMINNLINNYVSKVTS